MPVPRASGKAPRSAAIVVIRIGRNRCTHARWTASRAPRPWLRSRSSATSITMIAFFFTIPINKIIPIIAMTERSIPQIRSASSAPTPADGRVERIVNGWIRLS